MQITYEDKVALNENTGIADINKVKADDMNMIKNVVNANQEDVGDISNLKTKDITSIVNAVNEIEEENYYSTEEKQIGKWIDNKPIYRKVLSGTLPTGAGTNSFSISNSEIISVNGFVRSTYGQWWPISNYFSEQKYNISCRLSENRNGIELECGAFYKTSSKYFLIVEYTKTTDSPSN